MNGTTVEKPQDTVSQQPAQQLVKNKNDIVSAQNEIGNKLANDDAMNNL